MENNSEGNLTTLNCFENQTKCLIKDIPTGQVSPPILVSIIDTYGQKMVLEEALGMIELASDEYKNINLTENRMNMSNQKFLLKNVKTVKSSKGSFNFSEVNLPRKFHIYFE